MWTGSVNYSMLFCTRPQQRDSGRGGGTEANKENKKRILLKWHVKSLRKRRRVNCDCFEDRKAS